MITGFLTTHSLPSGRVHAWTVGRPERERGDSYLLFAMSIDFTVF